MSKVLIKLLILSLFIAIQSCSAPEIKIADISIKMDGSENPFQGLIEFGKKSKKALAKLKESKGYQDTNILVASESSSEGDSRSTLQLILPFDQTEELPKSELTVRGKEAFKVVIEVLQSSEPYDVYEAKFIRDASLDQEEESNFRTIKYTYPELVTTK